jgi:hypothetical protein
MPGGPDGAWPRFRPGRDARRPFRRVREPSLQEWVQRGYRPAEFGRTLSQPTLNHKVKGSKPSRPIPARMAKPFSRNHAGRPSR